MGINRNRNDRRRISMFGVIFIITKGFIKRRRLFVVGSGIFAEYVVHCSRDIHNQMGKEEREEIVIRYGKSK